VEVASPIQFSANTAYHLVSLETSRADPWQQYDTQVSVAPGVTISHPAHGSGGSYWTSATARNTSGPVSGSEHGAGGVGGLLSTWKDANVRKGRFKK
jgi:hypothetical protein